MMTEAQKQQMAEAVARIRAAMAEAARRAGRDPAEVALCAVYLALMAVVLGFFQDLLSVLNYL